MFSTIMPLYFDQFLSVSFIDEAVNSLQGVNRVLVPFVACGDLSGWDSDRTYGLELPALYGTFEQQRYVYKPVVQPPTEPAYKVIFIISLIWVHLLLFLFS